MENCKFVPCMCVSVSVEFLKRDKLEKNRNIILSNLNKGRITVLHAVLMATALTKAKRVFNYIESGFSNLEIVDSIYKLLDSGNSNAAGNLLSRKGYLFDSPKLFKDINNDIKKTIPKRAGRCMEPIGRVGKRRGRRVPDMSKGHFRG